MEIMSLKALQQMVESGLGIGVMPTDIINPSPLNTVVKNINNLSLKLPVGIALLAERNIPGLVLNVLIEFLRNGLQKN
jgi:DNA-binding transcriptional LysR family regulator